MQENNTKYNIFMVCYKTKSSYKDFQKFLNYKWGISYQLNRSGFCCEKMEEVQWIIEQSRIK